MSKYILHEFPTTHLIKDIGKTDISPDAAMIVQPHKIAVAAYYPHTHLTTHQRERRQRKHPPALEKQFFLFWFLVAWIFA